MDTLAVPIAPLLPAPLVTGTPVSRSLATLRCQGPQPVKISRLRELAAYGPDSLRGDFARFGFLVGLTDGEGLVAPDEP